MSYDDNTVITVSGNSSLNDFATCCSAIEEAGLTRSYLHDTKNIYCVTFLGGDQYIHAYYSKQTKETRIVTGSRDTYGSTDCSSQTGVSVTPSVTMVGQHAAYDNGQGFIFMLPDGRLIIQDGGNWYREKDKTDLIYQAIKSITPSTENIVIAAWFLSHPHDDHVGAFLEFVTNHKDNNKITLERVICNFASHNKYSYIREDGIVEDCGKHVTAIYDMCSLYFPETKVIKAHTGQVFDFGDARAEILFTVEDLQPVDKFDYVNSTSMVVRFYVVRQTVLLLADTTHASGRILENMYGDSLSSDIVQIAHHGMWASNASLYHCIKAPVILWPGLEKDVRKWIEDDTIVAALFYARDLYVADTCLSTISLPYESIDNKHEHINK